MSFRVSGRSVPPRYARRSIQFKTHQRAQSHNSSDVGNWLRNQLTYLGLVPRVHTSPRCHCPSRRVGSLAVCACRCALPPAVSPLGRALCSVALPSLVGWSSLPRSARDGWSPGEVRAYRTVRRTDEYSVRSRCYSGHHNRRKTRTHKGRKNNDPRGVHPFVNSNVMRTAARPRAALPSHNVQSSHPSPMT